MGALHAIKNNDEVFTTDKMSNNTTHKIVICWENVLIFGAMHVGGVYGLYLAITKAMWSTCLFTCIIYIISAIGVTAGAHRLWTHKSYKATLPLRIILLIFFTTAFQGSVYHWVREHRVHHKFCDTDADPHNSKRGFFFSHIGWLMCKKHPDVIVKGRTIYLSDIQDDTLLRFQQKYFFYFVILFCFSLPTFIPTLWGEDAWTAFYVAGVFRHIFQFNATTLINSAGHMWGTKPYDHNICPVESKTLSVLTGGEGFHNYHHTFPWDYRAAELGGYTLNISKLFIDIMAMIGWAYDLKTVSSDVIEKRVKTTGDGSHPVWGWGDKDLSLEDRKSAIIL